MNGSKLMTNPLRVLSLLEPQFQFRSLTKSNQLTKSVAGLGLLILIGLLPGRLEAQTSYGAIGLGGNWSDATTWTPGGGPPGLLDTANIGAFSPAGSTPTASVTLTGATSAAIVRLGVAGGTSGTLNLNGNILTVSNTIFLGLAATASATINHGGGSFITDTLDVRHASSFTYSAADTSNNLDLFFGGTANTTALSNISTLVRLSGQGSTLNLGANLVLSSDLDIRGTAANVATVNANGFDISARDVLIGRFGNAGDIINRGTITASRDLEVSRGTFSLNASDSLVRHAIASNIGTLDLHANTIAQGARLFSGGTMNTAATSNFSVDARVFDQGSTLNLGADLVLSEDLDIRGTLANVATVNANGFDISARDVLIGRFGNAGDIINRGTITASRDLEVSRGTFSLNASDSLVRHAIASNNGTLDLHANTIAQGARLFSGGTMNTAATSNFSVDARVFDQGSTLNLGADLLLSEDLDLRGTLASVATVNANGFDISARDVLIGRFGNAGDIINRGTITASRDLEVSRGTFSLNASDSLVRDAIASNNGTLDLHANTIAQGARLFSGGTMNTAATVNFSVDARVFDQGSTLNLGADLILSEDLDIRGTLANVATVNANGFNISARDVLIGRFGNAGDIINRGTITASRDLEVSRGTFSLNASDSLVRHAIVSSNGTLDLHANTIAQGARLFSGGTMNTAATSNFSVDARVFDQGSTLNLGADLVLSEDLDIRGTLTNVATVNANGFDISANRMYIGRFNNSGALLNDGAVTVNQLLMDRSAATLTGGDDVVQGVLNIFNSSTLNVLQSLGEMVGLTLNGNTLSIDPTSFLVLDFDAQINIGDDWAFRWLNPLGGDRITALNDFVNDGRIVINAPTMTSIYDGGDGYTYIGYTTVPEPSAWAFSLLALAATLRRRSRS